MNDMRRFNSKHFQDNMKGDIVWGYFSFADRVVCPVGIPCAGFIG